MPSEIILGDIMCLSNDVPKRIVTIIEEFNDALRDNMPQEAQARLMALQEAVPGHPELPRMRKRVERMLK